MGKYICASWNIFTSETIFIDIFNLALMYKQCTEKMLEEFYWGTYAIQAVPKLAWMQLHNYLISNEK